MGNKTALVVSAHSADFVWRAGGAIALHAGEGGDVTVSWREPRSREKQTTIYAGDVPIQSRGVAVDVSRMRPGRYSIEVTITKRGALPATARRELTLDKG